MKETPGKARVGTDFKYDSKYRALTETMKQGNELMLMYCLPWGKLKTTIKKVP